EKIREIQSREKVPILVGGTGLYIRAVLYQFQFTEEVGDEATRKKWEDYAEKYGNEQLHEQLAQVDPKSAASIHPNNIRRVVRALEIYEKTGQTKVEQEANTGDEIVIPHLIFGMDRPREELYERINERVIQMIEEGLEEEVRQLIADGFRNTQAMTGIGYKEWYPFLDGHLSKQAVIEAIQQNSRRYAKRQLTYFRHQLPVHWIDARRSIVDQVKEMEEIWIEKGKNDE
ncbi:MAG TPA: tRNA (adenosine(37)-N6)-dimethylallyltransferase MiaA, partial [Savagea sp.]